VGRHLGIDSAGTIVHTDDRHLVVTLGLKDTLVVHTPDATLVADRAHEEAVRKVVAELEKRGWNGYL
jgi:mannose-1-phosphate guanylyltransferase